MLKYLDEIDSLNLRRKNLYEPRETSIVKKELRRGDVFVDIGAHIGYYTVMAAEIVGKEGKVYAFEPASKNYEILVKNVEGMENVLTFNLAASSKSGVASLYLNPENSGDNRVNSPQKYFQEEKITTVILDDFMRGVERVDFVKIDVQGHELSVLEGMKGIIERFRGLKIIIEYSPVHLSLQGVNPKNLLKVLIEHGFSLKASKTHHFKKCTIENKKHCNIFCVREK